jgi:hypothetical protein
MATEKGFDFLYSQLMRSKVSPKWLWFLVILAATSYFILDPGGKPYVEVSGGQVAFELPNFNSCEVTLRSPVRLLSCRVSDANQPSLQSSNAPSTTPVTHGVKVIHVRNPAHSPGSAGPRQLVTISVESRAKIQIENISVDEQPLALAAFFKTNLKSNGDYVRFRYIRKILADVLFDWNDTISNWVLTAAFFVAVILATKVFGMEIRAYLYSGKQFKKHLVSVARVENFDTKAARRDGLDKYTAEWSYWDTGFRYVQALGPALGFVLTVGSLVQALHASSASADLEGFLAGIHVAMTSTFLGLVLRIVALEGARVNDVLLGKAEVILSSPSDSPQPELGLEQGKGII